MSNFPTSLPSSTPADHGEVIGEIVALAQGVAALRNAVINPRFRTNQRGYTSGTSLAASAFSFDRWKSLTAGTTVTFTAAPQGQTVNVTAGSLGQIIEQANVPADTYCLSWTGTATGRAYKVGAGAPSYTTSGNSWTVDGAGDWTIQFTGGTVDNVVFNQGAVPAPCYLPTLQQELAMCQRYFIRFGAPATTVTLGNAVADTTSKLMLTLPLPVEMRASPTATATNPTSFRLLVGGGAAALSAVAQATSSSKAVSFDLTQAGNVAAGNSARIDNGSNGVLDVSAEL